MWIILVLLWLLPTTLAIVIAARVMGGLTPVRDEEWRFVFGDTKQMKLSIWMLLSFALLAVLFFLIGLFESLVLLNLSAVWLVLVPLMTGLAGMLMVALWLRTGARVSPLRHRKTSSSHLRGNRTARISAD